MPALFHAAPCATASSTTSPPSRVLSVHDPVFPLLPFAGVLSVGHERGWLHDGLFPWFTAQAQADGAGARCSYSQAREAILKAQRLHGAPDLALLSGRRKSIPNLGVMGLGMLSHGTRGEAIRFGLDYQLVAGSMLRLQLQVERDADDGTAAIEAQALFCDEELRPFLDLDHLMTALNAIRQLPTCDAPFEVRRLELAFATPGDDDLSHEIEQVIGAPVLFGADTSRIVFDAHQVDTPLRFHDHALLVMSRHACEQELAGRGVQDHRLRAGVMQHLFGRHGELKTLADAAQELGVSLRSLHRLLAREGIDYSQLADRHRQELAQRLLRRGVGTQAVAEALGYSDSRCFRRAFRRWTGVAPSEYREKVTPMAS